MMEMSLLSNRIFYIRLMSLNSSLGFKKIDFLIDFFYKDIKKPTYPLRWNHCILSVYLSKIFHQMYKFKHNLIYFVVSCNRFFFMLKLSIIEFIQNNIIVITKPNII
jgi:hypothetical protein